MKIYEVIQTEDRIILDEGIKDTLKKLGLGALLAISVAVGSAQAKDYSATELLNLGFTQTQAEFISKLPEKQQALLVAKKEKAGDSTTVNFDNEKVNSVMKKISNDDPTIKSYDIEGKNLNIYIDSKIETGYKNFLKVQKKGNWQDINPQDALDYYGFNDSYKNSLYKMIPGLENINFKIAGSGN